MRLDEIELKQKAGVIPYFINEEGITAMLFMIPSNPKFGGLLFQIAKGKIEPGENIQEAALREAEEEVGLRAENVKQIKSVGNAKITGIDDTYMLAIFVVEIKDPKNFSQPHFETGKTAWLTLKQFKTLGRQSQLTLVTQANNTIWQSLNSKKLNKND